MKLARILGVCVALAFGPAAMGQKWEFGGGVGGGFYTSNDVAASAASASAKIRTNIAGSAWLGNSGQGHWGGELRYDYQGGDLQLRSSGTEASFASLTHAFHYDVLWHGSPNGSRVRPFLAVGAGIKVYQGTGTEVVFQPLSNLAILTKSQDLTPLISIGGGVKWQIAPHVQFRVDIHDYLTTFPTKVIVPVPGAKVGGWIHDFVPMAGISFVGGRTE
jgi:hypothetical protein